MNMTLERAISIMSPEPKSYEAIEAWKVIRSYLAQPAQLVDVERKYKWLCDAFDGMKTGESERFLECLGIEDDVCKSFDDLLTTALTEKAE